MTINGLLQVTIYFFVLLLLVKPLGWYMAQIYQGKHTRITCYFQPCEHFIYRLCGIDTKQEMSWKSYLIAMLLFNFFGLLAVYFIQRLQAYLPLNPQAFSTVSPDLAFNTAISFVTNTNWQSYGGESTLSYLTQMLALTVQNFLSAATGMSLLMALIRGLTKREDAHLGNYWVDMVRSVLYILLPLSTVFALLLASQGVIQNFKAYQTAHLTQAITYQQSKTDAAGNTVVDAKGNPATQTLTTSEQVIPMGPVASQVAIKQLGTNGGGFFNANSAYPYENPTPLSNFLEMLAIILIPAALCYTYGMLVGDKRQGWAVFAAMFLMLVPLVSWAIHTEQVGNPALTQLNVAQKPMQNMSSGGNMEGKETRFGIVNSALWAVVTTATSNGSVNSMHDSYMPLGGLITLWLMHLGEVVFGGVGSGLYGMIMLIILTVFVAGLMVGRTPEYLGKKIEPYEMKMASIAVLLMPLIVLLLTAVGVTTQYGTSSLANPGAHGFSEILYTFTSMGNNNGSAFAGLNSNTLFYNIIGGLEMIVLRFWIAIPALAVAGSLAKKKVIPTTVGTLPTHTPLFIILLIGITVVIGALTFFPALTLGPIVEHFTLWSQYGH